MVGGTPSPKNKNTIKAARRVRQRAAAAFGRRQFRAAGNPAELQGSESLFTLEYDPNNASKGKWVMTTNPVYWTGTRTQSIASTYMSVQIKRITIEYKAAATALQQGQVYLGFFRNEDLEVTVSGMATAESKAIVRTNRDASVTMSERYLMNIKQRYNQASPDEFPVMVAFVNGGGAGSATEPFIAGTITVHYHYQFQSPAVTPFHKDSMVTTLSKMAEMSSTIGAPQMAYLLDNAPAEAWFRHLVATGHNNSVGSIFSKLLKLGKKVICSLEPTGALKTIIDGVSAFVSSSVNSEDDVPTVVFYDKQTVTPDAVTADDELWIQPYPPFYNAETGNVVSTPVAPCGAGISGSTITLFNLNDKASGITFLPQGTYTITTGSGGASVTVRGLSEPQRITENLTWTKCTSDQLVALFPATSQAMMGTYIIFANCKVYGPSTSFPYSLKTVFVLLHVGESTFSLEEQGASGRSASSSRSAKMSGPVSQDPSATLVRDWTNFAKQCYVPGTSGGTGAYYCKLNSFGASSHYVLGQWNSVVQRNPEGTSTAWSMATTAWRMTVKGLPSFTDVGGSYDMDFVTAMSDVSGIPGNQIPSWFTVVTPLGYGSDELIALQKLLGLPLTPVI